MKNQTHDASTGFADIEPLEVVEPNVNTQGYLTAILLAFGVIFAILFTRHFFRLLKSDQAQEPAQPFKVCKEALKKHAHAFQSQEIGAREYSERVSLSIRNLLASVTDYPAGDRTLAEISDDFPTLLKERFNLLESKSLEETNVELVKVLSKTVEITFSNNQGIQDPQTISEQMESLTSSVVARLESHKIDQQKKQAEIDRLGDNKQ